MTEQVEKVALAPCGLCGSPCRVEIFGPSNNLETETQIWICSNAEWFKGKCRSASVYLSADDWNHYNQRTPPDDSVGRIVAWLRDTAAYTQDHGLSRAADMIEKADWR